MASESSRISQNGRTLSQSVTAELLEELREGRLRVGDRIPTERQMMELYGVGRNTVREAVQALVAMGALEVRPGRGGVVIAIPSENALPTSAVAALLDDATIVDLYEFRLLLETEAAARAATSASDDDRMAIRQALAQFQVAFEFEAPVYVADLAFHRAIAVASGNAIFPKVLDATADLLLSARRATGTVPEAVARAAAEHKLIWQAIEDGDPDRARSAMDSHIHSAMWALEEARRRTRGERS